AQCNDKKAKKAFIDGCGGPSKVQPFQKVLTFWKSLSVELQNQILNLSSGVIEKREWLALAQLSVEKVTQWCQQVPNGSDIISPKAWINSIRNLNPDSFPKKVSLKLGGILENEDFNVLLNKKEYNFTPDNLEEFKATVLASADPAIPLITEDLFPFLKDRGLNPLLILSPRDRERFEWEEKLKEKDKENEEMRSQFEQKLEQRDQRIEELEQQNQSQQTQITQQQTEIEELKQQNQQIFEQMKEFRAFMEESRTPVLT
ncbi:MAG: hypothetical protein AB4372_30680, partial [Xenococcus sp. (in: cyanobacteria)]